MITVKVNLAGLNESIKKLATLAESKDKMAREIAVSMAAEVRERIHEKGKDSSGEQIGTYKASYMRVRKKHKRTSDTKVILSLTTQMEQDFTLGEKNPEPTKTATGYGIGWQNEFNADKAKWNEEHFGKKIFELTDKEKEQVLEIANEFIRKNFGKI